MLCGNLAAVNANDSDPVHAKKPKVEGDRVSNDGILSKSVWECEGDKGAWTPYSDTQVKEIVEALKDGKPRIEVGTGKTKSEIVFERMVQRNVITGWERQVRCKAAGKTGEKMCYRYKISLFYLHVTGFPILDNLMENRSIWKVPVLKSNH